MRPTSRERQTGGVSPSEVAAAQDPQAVAEGAQVLPGHGAGRGVQVTRVRDRNFDPTAPQRLHDPAATIYFQPTAEPVRTYSLSPEQTEQFSREAAERGMDLVDYLREVSS